MKACLATGIMKSLGAVVAVGTQMQGGKVSSKLCEPWVLRAAEACHAWRLFALPPRLIAARVRHSSSIADTCQSLARVDPAAVDLAADVGGLPLRRASGFLQGLSSRRASAFLQRRNIHAKERPRVLPAATEAQPHDAFAGGRFVSFPHARAIEPADLVRAPFARREAKAVAEESAAVAAVLLVLHLVNVLVGSQLQ